jgi:hypothetical protein
MNCKVLVPRWISRLFREYDLPRSLSVRFWTRVHSNIPLIAPQFKQYRVPSDANSFQWRMVLADGNDRHLFTFAIDDKSEPDALIVVGLRHQRSS